MQAARGISTERWVLGAGLFVLAAMTAWMMVPQVTEQTQERDEAELARLVFEEQAGIHLVRVALTAGGGMIDLRYQITDPDKAIAVHDEENPPVIIDEATGLTFGRPWMDHAHDNDLHTAVTYYQLLMNPRGAIKRGNKVTVKVANAALEHVVVQ